MVKFFSLSSGSNGNCYYIGNGETALLIDAGIGPRTVKKRLAEHDISIESIEMVLVTHDHIDHIKSLGALADRYKIPVYATDSLHSSLDNHFCTRGKLSGCVKKTRPGFSTFHRGVSFTPFIVPHDATETVGYFINFYGIKFTFITDVGEITEDVIRYSKMANILIFESNYDLDMLLNGSYSPALKVRIMKGCGHLSNEQAASAIKRVYNPNLGNIFLCHLSENNNTPELAYNQIAGGLREIGIKAGRDVRVVCLPRRRVSELYMF